MKVVELIRKYLEPRKVVLQNIGITFVQGAFVAWSMTGYKLDKITLGAAIGAGFSAVWNILIKPYLKSLTERRS